MAAAAARRSAAPPGQQHAGRPYSPPSPPPPTVAHRCGLLRLLCPLLQQVYGGIWRPPAAQRAGGAGDGPPHRQRQLRQGWVAGHGLWRGWMECGLAGGAAFGAGALEMADCGSCCSAGAWVAGRGGPRRLSSLWHRAALGSGSLQCRQCRQPPFPLPQLSLVLGGHLSPRHPHTPHPTPTPHPHCTHARVHPTHPLSLPPLAVYRGLWKGGVVAVKVIDCDRPDSVAEDVLAEAVLSQGLVDQHIVRVSVD